MMRKCNKKELAKPAISSREREIITNRIKKLIVRLKDFHHLKSRVANITENELSSACVLLSDLLMHEPACLNLDVGSKLFIVGDILGHYSTLLQLFNILGHPPDSSYLFLGNYVNRGGQSIETVTLLFAYKIVYPTKIFLLRGKNECKQLGRRFGLYEECITRFTHRTWLKLNETFGYLPVTALIAQSIFCTPSGLAPCMIYSGLTGPQALCDYINTWIQRPTDIETNLLWTHLAWSEPDAQVESWERNPLGFGYLFGPKIVGQFCRQFRLLQVIRSNELVQGGYEFFTEPRLVTMHSTPDYLSSYRNCGSVLELTRTTQSNAVSCRVLIMRMLASQHGTRMDRAILDIKYSKVKHNNHRLSREDS